MQVYLNETTEFGSMGCWKMKSQNKYGTMYGFKTKLDLITTEYAGDYYVFHSPNGKVYLAVDSTSQLGVALGKVEASVKKDMGFTFKPAKKNVYPHT